MEYIDGIPIGSLEESVSETYQCFDLSFRDPKILPKAIEYLKQKQQENTVEAYGEAVFWLRSLWMAVAYQYWTSPHYYDWICAYSQFLLNVIQNTNELDLDYEIKYLLLGEQYLDDLYRALPGLDAIAGIFDARGLDFFLSYYFCGEVKEGVLLEYSGNRLCKVMQELGRIEESEKISFEIKNRTKGLRNAQRDGVLENLRLEAERAWFQYLGRENWRMLPSKERSELIDSYSMQRMIEYKVLKMWAPVVLAITKVVEAELNHALVKPWREFFASAEFKTPDITSKKQKKRIERRKLLFSSVKKAVATGPELSLGQIQVLLEHFDDELMDSCTDAFIKIKSALGILLPEFQQLLTQIQNCFSANNSEMSIVDLRNASAHPRPDSVNIDWRSSVLWLQQILGTPPLELLTNIRMLKQLSITALKRYNG